MPSPKEWVQTLGELGHASEFWNKLFKDPKEFIKQDVRVNPLAVFSMAAPLAAGGGAAVLSMALLGLCAIPSCVQPKKSDSHLEESARLESRVPLRSRQQQASPNSFQRAVQRPLYVPLHEPPHRRSRQHSVQLVLAQPRSARLIAMNNQPVCFVGASPMQHRSFITEDRRPNQRVVASFDEAEKWLRNNPSMRHMHSTAVMSHEVERVDAVHSNY